MPPDPRTVKAKHAEIERRYKRKRGRRHVSIAALRVNDLRKLFTARYGELFPNDDAGRDDAHVMVHHLGALSGDPRKRITPWLREHCPWTSLAEAEKLLVEAITRPQRWRADKLAWRLGLNEADRTALGITTIGAIDLSRADRIKRRKAKHRRLAIARRRAKGAKPRAQYLATSISRTRPWLQLGMSRAKWYRMGKPSLETA